LLNVIACEIQQNETRLPSGKTGLNNNALDANDTKMIYNGCPNRVNMEIEAWIQ